MAIFYFMVWSRNTPRHVCHFLCVHFESSVCRKRFLVLAWLLSDYCYGKSTIVMSGWVIFCKVAAIYIFSVLEIKFLSGLPAKSKTFSLFYFSTLFVKFLKIITIWGRFFFCVPKNNLRYWFFLSFPKCACSCCFCFRQLWLKDIKIIWLINLESGIFREGISMRCVSPSRRGLIPVREIFFDRDGCIVQRDRYFFIGWRASFGWDVTTHVHGGKIAFSFFSLFHFNFIYYYF